MFPHYGPIKRVGVVVEFVDGVREVMVLDAPDAVTYEVKEEREYIGRGGFIGNGRRDVKLNISNAALMRMFKLQPGAAEDPFQTPPAELERGTGHGHDTD